MSIVHDLEQRGQLPAPVDRELDALVTRLRRGLNGEWTPLAILTERFSASTGNWVVNPNLASVRFYRLGLTMWLDFRILQSSVTGGAPGELRMALPNGISATCAKAVPIAAVDNGIARTCVARASVTAAYIAFTNPAAGTWAGSTTATDVEGQIALEVK